MPDELTATNALLNGEIDYIEAMPYDLLPMVESRSGFKVEILDKLGLWTYYRFNFLHPPFNNKLIRRAAMHAVGQEDILKALTGNPKYHQHMHGHLRLRYDLCKQLRLRLSHSGQPR